MVESVFHRIEIGDAYGPVLKSRQWLQIDLYFPTSIGWKELIEVGLRGQSLWLSGFDNFVSNTFFKVGHAVRRSKPHNFPEPFRTCHFSLGTGGCGGFAHGFSWNSNCKIEGTISMTYNRSFGRTI
jgi:hypothetical protein